MEHLPWAELWRLDGSVRWPLLFLLSAVPRRTESIRPETMRPVQ